CTSLLLFSLHAALPILSLLPGDQVPRDDDDAVLFPWPIAPAGPPTDIVQHLAVVEPGRQRELLPQLLHPLAYQVAGGDDQDSPRSEEHTSELQSRVDLV